MTTTDRFNLLAEYRYNGLNQRITAHFDTDADGNIDGDDPVTHFAYDSRWRIVARFEDTNSDPTEQFVFHHAGLASAGSGSYIDAVILRDRDTTGNGTLDERVYHLQNWRSDVVALISAAGTQIEQVRYEPYGTPFGLPAGDTNADGDVTSTDVNQVTTWYSTSAYDIRGDLDMDGIVSISDVAYAAANEYLGHSTGRGKLSLVANRKGYAGYEHLAELEASGTKWDVRNRVLISEIGHLSIPLGAGLISRQHQLVQSLRPHQQGPYIIERDMLGLWQSCLLDPLVAAARQLYERHCGDRRLTVRCDERIPQEARAVFCCGDHSVRFRCSRPLSCSTLAHEILHAADMCSWGRRCRQTDFDWDPTCGGVNPDSDSCIYSQCTEARGNYLSCCELVHEGHFASMDECKNLRMSIYCGNGCGLLLGSQRCYQVWDHCWPDQLDCKSPWPIPDIRPPWWLFQEATGGQGIH